MNQALSEERLTMNELQPDWPESNLCWLVLAALLLMVLFGGALFAGEKPADANGAAKFATADDAAKALVAACQTKDDAKLIAILGPAGAEVIGSGDPAEDAAARANFVKKYAEMHRFKRQKGGALTLVVGPENWPLPIPLVKKDGEWSFDAAAAKDEILFRRIGQNEIAAILASGELVQGEKAYFANNKQYAQKLLSETGKKDGLYWTGATDSINPYLAHAWGDAPSDQRVPFNGYYFRVLTQQGAGAEGGAKNYVADGKMSGGFAFLAYPGEYRSSGVMTFIVSDAGVLYEKDLGADTVKMAQGMNSFDPNDTWKRVD